MAVIALTEAIIKSAKCPDGKSKEELCDKDLPGLILNLYPSGKSSYSLRYKIHGQTKYAPIGSSDVVTLSDARKKAKMLKAEIALNGADPRAAVRAQREMLTFDEYFVKHYLPHAKVHKRSWVRDEQLYRIRIKPVFGSRKLNQISRQQIQTFHAGLLAEGLAPASCDYHIRFIKHAFNLAIDWELFAGPNPASRAPLFNVDNKVEHYLDNAEMERLLTVLRTDENRPVCLIVLFLLSTGARLNEALSAKWCNVDIVNRIWRIPASNSKSKRIRSVPLNDSALDVLKQLDTKNHFEYLFINKQTRQRYTTIMKVWSRLRNKAGLPHLRVHDTRHNFSAIVLSSGRTLYELQSILGHASPVTTSQRYAFVSSAVLQDAANSVSAIIKGTKKSKVKESARL